jgi:hypothetical protein
MSFSNNAINYSGMISPALTNTFYPTEYLTKLHYALHIPGTTHTWMDTGLFTQGGSVAGGFHRLSHGHHLFKDGFTVLTNPNLSFGEFLHHLGLDFMTKRGIPIPIFPPSMGESLINLGLSRTVVSELMSVNLPKLLTGSLSLVVSGHNVLLAFSDAIPHTLSHALFHTGLGAAQLAFGCFPPNIFILTAGAMQTAVGLTTLYRYIVDPVIPAFGVPGSVFFPAIWQSFAISSVIGAGISALSGGTISQISKNTLSAGCAGASSKSASFAATASGMLGPFWGVGAGIATYYIVRNVLEYMFPERTKEIHTIYPDTSKYITSNSVFPLFGLPSNRIGYLDDDGSLFMEKGF